MSWTKLLEQRRYPLDAEIGIDLPCTRCGYNLRGARVVARCPECGTFVGDSLRLLAKPDEVSNALRDIGKTYLTLLALCASCLQVAAASAIPALAIYVIVAGGLGFRLFGARDLRYRVGLESHPTVGGRVRLFWVASLVEAAMLASILVLAIAMRFAPPGAPTIPDPVMHALIVAWLAVTFVNMGIVGGLGRALAGWLEYEAIRRGFGVQRALVAAGFAFGILPLAYGWFATPAGALGGSWIGASAAMSGALFLIAWGSAILATFAALLHLSEAAQRERDELEEAVKGGKREPILPFEPVPERPDIDLE
jgi:hypothetical protein